MLIPEKILIIQTASIGDVILATPVIESLRKQFPESIIDFFLKSGNEGLFEGHPHLRKTISWDKKNNKYGNLFRIIRDIRKEKYDLVVNIQRFASSGIVTALSSAKTTIGFDKNPLSRFFTIRVKHKIGDSAVHEIDRNLSLISSTVSVIRKVKLCPSADDYKRVMQYSINPYICIAPASLWFTKQYPAIKWIEFLKGVDEKSRVNFIGSGKDFPLCDEIIKGSGHRNTENLAGKLTLLQTAALMENAKMNFVNDSAPVHLASAVNARVTVMFCSTVPDFGFGPLSDDSVIIQTAKHLECRPCGLHGFRKCPEKHFDCALTIDNQQLLKRI